MEDGGRGGDEAGGGGREQGDRREGRERWGEAAWPGRHAADSQCKAGQQLWEAGRQDRSNPYTNISFQTSFHPNIALRFVSIKKKCVVLYLY